MVEYVTMKDIWHHPIAALWIHVIISAYEERGHEHEYKTERR
jgi:hypothetical protein